MRLFGRPAIDGKAVIPDAYYSHTGRPSIDPALMIRMLVIGYRFGIRSEWRLCEEADRAFNVMQIS